MRRFVNGDHTAGRFNDLLDNGQAEACAAVVTGAGAVDLTEAIKDRLSHIDGNSWPGIAHDENDLLVFNRAS